MNRDNSKPAEGVLKPGRLFLDVRTKAAFKRQINGQPVNNRDMQEGRE